MTVSFLQAQPQEQLKNNVIKVKVPVTDANGNQIGDREDVVDIRTGRSSDDGIIYHNDPLSLYNFRDHI